ncbi:MAG: amidase family protein [Candidatus Methanomethylophilaceae archaeon]|nr:amidase family protein [Candidatus Methanomethylophilaceae archaeon]
MFCAINPDLDHLQDGQFDFHFSAKDNLTTVGLPTRAGSRILEGYRPAFDAHAVEAMRQAGGLLLGKTNMDEFGFGTFSTNSAFGVPRNPFDLDRSCGGSSGGAACATAVLDGHVALGVSTGGSISCPAAFCGVMGLTPTYGRVSRHGLLDYGNSLDKVGLISRRAADLEMHLRNIAGPDPRDPTSCAQPPMGKSAPVRSIAVPKDALEGVSDEVSRSFQDALDRLRDDLGLKVETVETPSFRFAMPSYYVLGCSEASTNLARYCGLRYGVQSEEITEHFDKYFSRIRSENFGREAKRRILLGTFARMVGFRDRYYMKALQVRELIIQEYQRVFQDHDLLLTPAMPFTAPRFDAIDDMDILEVYKADYLTIPPNISGMPHLSMPCGYAQGMPVGMQFVANHWQEGLLFDIAQRWEEAFRLRAPEVTA